MTARVIVMTLDEWMFPEDLVYACALHTHAATVDDADVTQAERMRFLQIGIDHVRNVPRRERMQIEL